MGIGKVPQLIEFSLNLGEVELIRVIQVVISVPEQTSVTPGGEQIKISSALLVIDVAISDFSI